MFLVPFFQTVDMSLCENFCQVMSGGEVVEISKEQCKTLSEYFSQILDNEDLQVKTQENVDFDEIFSGNCVKFAFCHVQNVGNVLFDDVVAEIPQNGENICLYFGSHGKFNGNKVCLSAENESVETFINYANGLLNTDNEDDLSDENLQTDESEVA